VEPGYLNDPTKFSALRSALAVPLEGSSSVVAVLALYRAQADSFSKNDLGAIMGMAPQVATVIERASSLKALSHAVGSH